MVKPTAAPEVPTSKKTWRQKCSLANTTREKKIEPLAEPAVVESAGNTTRLHYSMQSQSSESVGNDVAGVDQGGAGSVSEDMAAGPSVIDVRAFGSSGVDSALLLDDPGSNDPDDDQHQMMQSVINQ